MSDKENERIAFAEWQKTNPAYTHQMVQAFCDGRDSRNAEIAELRAELALRDALAGEPVGCFAYSEVGGYEEFATQEEAIACAKGDIETARGDSCDGWPDSVNSIVWGVVMQRATQTGLREKEDNDNVASYITEVCDYDLLPVLNAAPPAPAVLHPDDIAFDKFATACKLKLESARKKGRKGWEDPITCSHKILADLLMQHLVKGNPGTFEDVANFAMMLAQQSVSSMPSILSPIMAELERAMRKFPTWPTDPIHASKILDEEVGELSKAVLQATYEPHKSGPEEIKAEAIQAAAMAIRFIASLDKYQYTQSAQHEQPALTEGK